MSLFFLCVSHMSFACQPLIKDELTPISKQSATGALNQTLFNSQSKTAKPLESLATIECYLSSDMNSNSAHSSILKSIRTPLKQLSTLFLQAHSPQQKRTAIKAINSQINRDSGTGFVVFPSTTGNLIELNLFSTLIDQSCQETATVDCAKATELAQRLWWIAGEYRGLSDVLNQQDQQLSLVFNQKIDTQWRSYKEDTIALWPQEVLLNSILYSPTKNGLSSPPNYKLLSLRPSVGLSYLSEQSHRIQPTINLDVIGLYWWRYGNNNKAQSGRGLAASLVWDGDDTAYGISYYHNPKWSLTIARGDDNDVVASISFQLAHWFLKN